MMDKSPVVKAVKKVLPATVSIVISKDLPVLGDPLSSPSFNYGTFGGTPPQREEKVQTGGGSGFIIDSEGIILTNRHVVSDLQAEYIVLLNNDEKHQATVIARDPINDIAILKIDVKKSPALELGDSRFLDLGQSIIAIGNALGAFQNTVSVGVISGLSREITAGDSHTGQLTKLRGLIQTDAAINPGNSGGPLISLDGRVIGINAAMVFGAENIGFALPINAAKRDLEDVKEYGRIRQPFLGVRYILINKDLQGRHQLPVDYGALVLSENIPGGDAVIADSPAAKAGLQEGDIVLECQKEKISEKNTLTDILQNFDIGDKLLFKVLRGPKTTTCKMVLEERK